MKSFNIADVGNYNVADIIINYKFNKEVVKYIDRYEKFRQIRYVNNNNNNKFTYDIKCVKEMPELKSESIYEDGEFKIFKENNKEIRAFYKYDEFYAMCKEVEPYKYEINILEDYSCYMNNMLGVLNYTSMESMLLKYNAFILHSSFIKYKQNGILFTAPSGTGKSTQADLWNLYKNANIINGDRALIKKYNDRWSAFGLPFCGTSEICNHDMADLSAIIVIKQSPVNKIKRLNKHESVKKLISETTVNYWNSDFVNKIVDLTSELVEDVPVYEFLCTKDSEAVDVLFNKLKGDGIID